MPSRRRRKNSVEIGLDSLVDIVSNSVGILIIMAAFMAMLTQFSAVQPEASPTESRLLQLPWSHPSDKKFALFSISENKIHYLDLKPFYLALANTPSSAVPINIATPENQLNIRFFPISNQIYCLEINPLNLNGESWTEAQSESSHWKTARLRHPPEEYIYFFWVTTDSFANFRQIRTNLQSQGIEVGWMPHRPKQPWEFCNGFGGTAAFRAQ